jgi:anaerobic magnesium-protoporphyrin IX monomethyl ester cyclase
MLNEINVKIIFPPQFEPFQPYLSLPYLKALLKLYGIKSNYYDANVEFFWWCFNNRDKLLTFNDLTKAEQYIYLNLDKAIAFIKNGEYYPFYRWAINIIEGYLSLIETEKFKLSLYSFDYESKFQSESIKEKLCFEDSTLDHFITDNQNLIIDKDTTHYFFSITVIDQFLPALKISRRIKCQKPYSIIVFGGAWVSKMKNTLKEVNWLNQEIDIISYNEGYFAIKEIFNMDNLIIDHVTPDYSQLDFSKYLSPEIVLPYLIANGCKWGKCNFCSHHLSYHSYRSSTCDEVLKDLKYIKNTYGVNYISFSDEYIPADFLKEFTKKIILDGIKLNWSTFVRAEKELGNPSFAKSIYKSGGRVLFIGFETLSQRLLNLMKKGNNASWYKDILGACYDSKISIRLDFMLNYPSETYDEYVETMNFVKRHKNLIDTPFSSYAVAIFELKKDTPITKLSPFNSSKLVSLRGDLDDQLVCQQTYSDQYKTGLNKRREMLSIYKNLKAEVFTPINKTHQLIFKGYFDEKKITIPPLDLENFKNNSQFKIALNDGVVIEEQEGKLVLKNYSNGSILEISTELKPIIQLLSKKIVLKAIYNRLPEKMVLPVSKVFHYLLRKDFIVIIN